MQFFIDLKNEKVNGMITDVFPDLVFDHGLCVVDIAEDANVFKVKNYLLGEFGDQIDFEEFEDLDGTVVMQNYSDEELEKEFQEIIASKYK